MNILGSHLNVQQILDFEIPETLNFANISQSRYNDRYEKLIKTTTLLNINNDNKWAYLVHMTGLQQVLCTLHTLHPLLSVFLER